MQSRSVFRLVALLLCTSLACRGVADGAENVVAAWRNARLRRSSSRAQFTPGNFQQYNIADAAGAAAQVRGLPPAPPIATSQNRMNVTIEMILQNQHIARLGDRGPAVTELKQFFKLQPVDDNFGETLKAAVAAFQQQKRLKPPAGSEGTIGSTTMRCLLGAWPGCQVAATAAKPPAAAAGAPQAYQAATAGPAPAGKYPGCNPTPAAIAQMEALFNYARSHNNGASRGRCFEWVWKYIMAKGFGKIRSGSAPGEAEMCSNYAICFGRFANNANSARRWGLCRLQIQTPHDAPRGAIVVVGPPPPHGCGTAHPQAGDVAIAYGPGSDAKFINDGPSMTYGSKASFLSNRCRFIGAYVAVEV